MSERLRIQKQMAQIKEDFPYLAQFLAGWPASTHGAQVLGLAEMKAKEMLAGVPGAAVFAINPVNTPANNPSQPSAINPDARASGNSGAQEANSNAKQAENQGQKIQRRQLNLGGLGIEE